MHALRGGRIAMIFQEPMTSLSPLHTIGNQIAEAIMHQDGCAKAGDRSDSWRCCQRIGLPDQAGFDTIRTSSPGACGSAP